MLATRVIARLDVKPGLGVVKGRRMEGLRIVGSLDHLAARYQEDGADELLVLDLRASLYGLRTDNIMALPDIFIPCMYGGGVDSVEVVRRHLRDGIVDKVAINTAALRNPELLRALARAYGSQAIVCQVDAANWQAYGETGRWASGRHAVGWAEEAVALGAGELLVTSVDHDGLMAGCDLELIRALSHLPVPIVASGGIGSPDDTLRALEAGADAVAIGAALHARKTSIAAVKDYLAAHGVPVRG